MTESTRFFINSRKALEQAFRFLAGLGYEVSYIIEAKPRTRSLEQNALLWKLLTIISEQVVWHGNKLSQSDWKHIFTASLSQQRVVPNIDGTGFVVLGKSTSKMSVKEMTDLIELIYAFGVQRGVNFDE